MKFSRIFREEKDGVVVADPVAHTRLEPGDPTDAPDDLSLEILGTTDASQVEIALRNLGFEVKRVNRQLGAGDPSIGQVLGIDPSPGTDLLLGSEVVLIVGSGDAGSGTGSTFITVEPSD